MALAEALSLRAELIKRYEQLRQRAELGIRYQEGDEPEDTRETLAAAEQALGELESLVARINLANTTVTLDDGTTLTQALARRDALRLQQKLHSSMAVAAGSRGYGFVSRQRPTELRTMVTIPVKESQDKADAIATEIRQLDARIQRANWDNAIEE